MREKSSLLAFCYQSGNLLVPFLRLAGLLLYSVLPPTALAQSEREHVSPLWVLKRPKHEGFFVGIGVAQREGNLPESKDKALKRALENIAAQIETSVFGEMHMKETEKTGELGQEYRAEIKTIVSATLEGVQIVDTWEDTENCWVYARLSVARFERLRQEKIERARRLAFNLFWQAEERAGATAEALSLYLQALQPIHDSLGDPLRVTHRGKAITLDTEIPLRIQSILYSVELEASPVTSPLKQGTTIDVPLTVRAFVNDKQGRRQSVDGVPIRFAFERGRGDLVARVWTDDTGRAISALRKVHDPAPVQVVQAKIDLTSFSAQGVRDPALRQQLLRFTVPSAAFQLDVSQQMVYVISDESNLGDSLETRYMQPTVREYLAEAGLALVDGPGHADLVVEICARTRQGNRFQDIYFSFLDMTVSVRNRDPGNELLYTSLTNVKGSGIRRTCGDQGLS